MKTTATTPQDATCRMTHEIAMKVPLRIRRDFRFLRARSSRCVHLLSVFPLRRNGGRCDEGHGKATCRAAFAHARRRSVFGRGCAIEMSPRTSLRSLLVLVAIGAGIGAVHCSSSDSGMSGPSCAFTNADPVTIRHLTAEQQTLVTRASARTKGALSGAE